MQTKRVKRDPDFARPQNKRGSRPRAASSHATPPCILPANRLIQALAAVHQRMPVIRIRQPRNRLPDKAKHPQPLGDIEPDDGEYPDHGSDQRRADKALVSCYAHNQAESQQRKTDLDKNAQCDVDENARRRGWYWRATEGREPRPDDVTTNSGRRDQCAHRFTDPAHPKQLPQR